MEAKTTKKEKNINKIWKKDLQQEFDFAIIVMLPI